ncbi:MAG TPA: hypothetical protein VJ691_11655 [Vicinamibacterales bacterium]|nr:hypothetical protein [Vicinamibacterales bacterium]
MLFCEPMHVARTTRAAIVLTVAWLMAYGATLFGGFVRDDFGWIFHSRLSGWSSIPALLTDSHLF